MMAEEGFGIDVDGFSVGHRRMEAAQRRVRIRLVQVFHALVKKILKR